jgi:epoxide hydrolase-like predicted phosphatase
MIKNIIFDLGNVLIDFNPKKYLMNEGLIDADLEFVYKEIFLSNEWVELDRGTMTREEALKSITFRNPDKIKLLMDFAHFEEVLIPIESNVEILLELKNRGYKTFYLTNYHIEAFDFAFSNFDFFKCFDGGVVSAKVKLIKPDPRIYRTLQENYNLIPEESLFIDDTKNNVEVAAELGFHTIHLLNQEDLKALLDKYSGPSV